jgi:hypothetical protein
MSIAENLTRNWSPIITDRRQWDQNPARAFHARLNPDSVPPTLQGWATRYGLIGPWVACGTSSAEASSAFQPELIRRCNLALDSATEEKRRALNEYDDLMKAIAQELQET